MWIKRVTNPKALELGAWENVTGIGWGLGCSPVSPPDVGEGVLAGAQHQLVHGVRLLWRGRRWEQDMSVAPRLHPEPHVQYSSFRHLVYATLRHVEKLSIPVAVGKQLFAFALVNLTIWKQSVHTQIQQDGHTALWFSFIYRQHNFLF